MFSYRRQRGITLLGFIIVLAIVGFFAFIGMKIGPAYLEFFNVRTAMKGVAAEPGAATWSAAQIRLALEKRLYINYVNEKHVGLKHFEIKRQGGEQTVRVVYEVREDLLYNLDYVASFDYSVKLTRGGNFDP